MEFITPAGKLDFAQSYSGWMADGDEIDTSVWTIEAGLTLDAEAIDKPTSVVTAIIEHTGTNEIGKVYEVQNEIVTTNGLEFSTIWILKCQERPV